MHKPHFSRDPLHHVSEIDNINHGRMRNPDAVQPVSHAMHNVNNLYHPHASNDYKQGAMDTIHKIHKILAPRGINVHHLLSQHK